MSPTKSFEPLDTSRLDAQLEAALVCLGHLGPYAATTPLPSWLHDAMVSLLRSVEEFLPEENFFDGIKDKEGRPQAPSSLAQKAEKCWELILPLSLGRNALRLFAETDKPQFGFIPKHEK